MNTTIEIYQITYQNNTGHVRLLFPTINDIKCLLKENEDLFDMLLLKQLDITPLHVMKDSKYHKIALANSLVKIPC